MTKIVAVIGGTGNEGPGLALRWAKSGQYQVIIGSRQAEKGERVAADHARQRILERLRSVEVEDPPVEYRFSMADLWSRGQGRLGAEHLKT